MPLAGTNPSIHRDNDRNGIINNRNLNSRLHLGFHKGSTSITKALGVFSNLLAHRLTKRALVIENLRKLIGLIPKLVKLFFYFNRLKPSQLTQPKLKNIFRLKLR